MPTFISRKSTCLLAAMAILVMLYLYLLLVPINCLGFTEVDFKFFNNSSRVCADPIRNNNSAYLYHLPTHEGLLSHYYQLEVLWIIANGVGLQKPIYEVPFRSHHFKEVKRVSLCDIFQFPEGIQCSCFTPEQVGRTQGYCPMLGFRSSWSTHERDYGLNDSTTEITAEADLGNVTCVAGMVNALQYSSRYKQIILDNRDKNNFEVRFNHKFMKLAEIVRTMIAPLTGNFVAVHWRRGDQITTRCKDKFGMVADHSVNCDSVSDFVDAVEAQKGLLLAQTPSGAAVQVYVATNENNATILQELHSAGYVTSVNITNVLKPYTTLHTDDIFALELVFMCIAENFVHFGESATHKFITDCRATRSNATSS